MREMEALEKLKELGITEDEVAIIYHREIKKRVLDFLPVLCGILTEAMIDTNAETMNFSADIEKFKKRCQVKIKISDL